jgi:hypothetical protein
VTVAGSLLLLIWIRSASARAGTIREGADCGPRARPRRGRFPGPESVASQLSYAVAAIFAVAVASGLYLGADWGPGPRGGCVAPECWAA